MARATSPRPKLSLEQTKAICRALAPVGDHVFDHMARLEAAGFRAFLPRSRFVESFAADPDVLRVHRRCVVEHAKERLVEPSYMLGYRQQAYVSPYLEQLRKERDEANGVGVGELRNRYPDVAEAIWREHADPCQRALVRDRIENFQAHHARFEEMQDETRAAFQDEARHHASGLGGIVPSWNGHSGPEFFAAVMARDAAPLGFDHDKGKSQANCPVFSKAITDTWHLTWAVPFGRGLADGYFAPSLELRSRKLGGLLIDAVPGERLHIRHSHIVPGFFNSYWHFATADELERAIRAHLYLYGLMAPIIEAGIVEVLGQAAPT